MSVLVFLDNTDGFIKKASLEALSYGEDLAKLCNTSTAAVVIGKTNEDCSQLGKYGVQKVFQLGNELSSMPGSDACVIAISELVVSTGATMLVFSHSLTGKAIAPMLAAKLKAGLVTGVVALPTLTDQFVVKRSVFSGKAFANVAIHSALKIISINPNSYSIKETGNAVAEVINSPIQLPASKIKVTHTQKSSGELLLTEAEKVVSAGRGMKGPENWGMVEELAASLGAALACSRPVADAHWRPHHEHVGQTGIAIAPNLYIAIGISGAIQHLAGVNRSKVIVVINKDPEAPFFKAADYGIVGDAFEVLPKITAAIKKLKAS